MKIIHLKFISNNASIVEPLYHSNFKVQCNSINFRFNLNGNENKIELLNKKIYDEFRYDWVLFMKDVNTREESMYTSINIHAKRTLAAVTEEHREWWESLYNSNRGELRRWLDLFRDALFRMDAN